MTVKTLIGAALAAVVLSPGIASADFVLDTGTPTGTGAPTVLNSAQWVAAEFTATAGQTIDSVAAYLTQGLGQPGDTFTFDIYSSAGFTGRANGRGLITSTTGTFTSNGWNTAAIDWTPTATTQYWLALQVLAPTNTKGLDLPTEAAAATGTVPAQAFAFLGSNGQFSTSGAPTFGVQISAVPLPAAAWFFGSGILGLAALKRRRRAVDSAR